MKRLLLLSLILLTAAPLFAFTTTAASSASQNTGTVRGVMEPVISVVQINGVTHGAAAYMNFADATNAPLVSRIQVSHTTDFVNWSAPVNLPLNATNGVTYERSGDPVFVEGNGWPYQGWIFCFGTMWTNTNFRGKSTIGAWSSSDGGVTWSQPDALDNLDTVNSSGCEQVGTCIFDDKPAATISPAPNISGTIYVTWTRVTASTTNAYMSILIPTRGWSFQGLIAANLNYIPGPTPVFDSNSGQVQVLLMDRIAKTIDVYRDVSGTWTKVSSASAPGIDVPLVQVGSTFVRAFSFLNLKFDNLYHHIFVVYHREEAGLTQVVYRRFNPVSLAWTQPWAFQSSGHRQWNPTLVQMDSGDFVISYYDYNSGDPGYTLYATRINLYGLNAETTRIFSAEFSDPAFYNVESQGGPSRLGEYQGLATLNGVLYAATIYIPQTTPRVGNAWVVRFVPGP